MMRNNLFCLIGLGCFVAMLSSACIDVKPQTKPQTTFTAPTPTPILLTKNPLIISEVMAGNADYIEIFNASSQAINLKGHYLVYRLGTDNLDQPIFRFEQDVILPGYTHYLLGREGDEFAIPPDDIFLTQMNIKTGGIGLYGVDDTLIDALAWGKAPALFTEGASLPDIPRDASLTRFVNDDIHYSYIDNDDNLSDFSIAKPTPQNSHTWEGDSDRPRVYLESPATIKPGASARYQLVVENPTDTSLTNVSLILPVPSLLTIETISDHGQLVDDHTVWPITQLDAQETMRRSISVRVPYIYTQVLLTNYRLESTNQNTVALPVYGPPVKTNIKGGLIPVQIARQLAGERVTVEGIATMYTGGFYAGGGNVKFYLQDATGGIQIQVFDENGPVPTVAVGDKVRVSGTVSVYRDSLQISPDVLPEDVTIIDKAADQTNTVIPTLMADIPAATANISEYSIG